MTKEKLFEYMDYCLKVAAQTDSRNIISACYQQGFGATMFYVAFYLKEEAKTREVEKEKEEILNKLMTFGDEISQLRVSVVEEDV